MILKRLRQVDIKRYTLQAFCCLLVSSAFGQEVRAPVITASGNQTTSNQLTLQWTLGELGTTNYRNELLEGIHALGQGNGLSTAIHEISNIETIGLSPNPSNGVLRFPDIIERKSEDWHMHVYNVQGVEIYETAIQANQLNISILRNGIYFILFRQGKNKGFVSKIVLQK